MKFRLLNTEELEGLKDEFIKFLIVQGIDAAEWQRLKGDEPVRALNILEIFSDFIFSEIVENIRFIEYFNNSSLKLFKCDTDKIYLINIICSEKIDDIGTFLEEIQHKPEKFDIQNAEKSYLPDRATEIFKMMMSGGVKSDGKLYEAFDLPLSSDQFLD